MSIRIISEDSEIKYDSTKPLEEQICDSQSIVINYNPLSSDIDRFTEEMERLCKSGISVNANIHIAHNDFIKGARTKKHINRLVKNLDINETVKLLVTLQSTMDKALGELASYCQKR